MSWQPIDTAPQNGTEVLVCSVQDCSGVLFAQYGALEELVDTSDIEDDLSQGDLEEPDWWVYTVEGICRCDVTLTHWMPLPNEPEEKTEKPMWEDAPKEVFNCWFPTD